MKRMLLVSAVLLAALAVPGVLAAGPATASADPCAAHTAAFRGRLEPVIEAAIDEEPQHAGPAAKKAAAYWKGHRASFPAGASADTLVLALEADAAASRTTEAARLAVALSDSSFGWCEGELSIADHLMRIDLVGETAWLRAHGEPIDWPARAEDSVAAVLDTLNAKDLTGFAETLRGDVAAAMKIEVATKPSAMDGRTATELLDMVDVVEKELR